MNIVIPGLLFLSLLISLPSFARAEEIFQRPEKLFKLVSLLPADDDIVGWKRYEKTLQASTAEELYGIFNGGATLYIQYGFDSFVGQSYKGTRGTEMEVQIFNQGNSHNAENIFENPFAKPSRGREMRKIGEKTRLDESSLFSYGVDFIQKGLFVRVIVQDKSEEGLKEATSFARFISQKIK
jgi:hypothetical protein